MLTFTRYVLLFTTLLCSVLAVPLGRRDVVSPPITSPTTGTVWHVGQTQTVTWNATGLPVNQTNPVGMLVLGYLYNNSENLMLDSPLATHLDYSVGQAQITVPNVPTREDYIVVLFGDSGNASPEFTIINDASSSTSVPSTSVAPTPVPSNSPGPSPTTSTPASTPAPVNANSIGGSDGSSSTPVTGSLTTGASPTTTASSGHSAASSSSTTVTVTSSATPSSTKTSAAWRKHAPSVGTSLSVALAFTYFAFS